MEMKNFAKSNNKVSRLGFGCWGIGKSMWIGADDSESKKTMHRAIDEGINFFDRSKEKFISFNESDGLISNSVYGILDDNNGNLWLSTQSGISKMEILSTKDGIPEKVKGVIVSGIKPESPAYGVLTEGDVIMEINRQNVYSTGEYTSVVKKIKKHADILLLVYRNGMTLYITLSNR